MIETTTSTPLSATSTSENTIVGPTLSFPSCGTAQQCTYQFRVDNSLEDGILSNTNFLLEVDSIVDVSVEIATVYGEDVEIVLYPPNDKKEYRLMRDTKADTCTTGNCVDLEDFDMGNQANDSSLTNAGTYIFVETGGLTGYTAPYSPPGVYNADRLPEAAERGPYGVGEWNLEILDNARGAVTSIGGVVIRYCGVCR